VAGRRSGANYHLCSHYGQPGHPVGTRPCFRHAMKSALRIRPKPAARPKPPPIPLDPEAAALYLAEIMSPAMRRELGRLLVAFG